MRRALVVTTMLLAAGCQRGCLSAWILEQGPAPGASADPRTSPLTSIDCPDGLVRCHAGLAQRSKGGAIPMGCRSTPENPRACECPFVTVATCSEGCVVEDLTLVGADAVRTCAPRRTSDASALPTQRPAAGCSGEGTRFRCESSAVLACADAGPEPVATCLGGCVVEGEELDDEGVDIHAAVGLLCTAPRDTL